MKFNFELYLKSNVADKEQWQHFFSALTAHIGYMNQCQITLTIKDSVVRIFVSADKDLGVLSNNIDIGVLKPAKKELCEPPKIKGTEHFVVLGNVKNFLELREKMKIKRGKELEYVVLNCRRVNVDKTLTRIHYYLKKPDGSYAVNKKTLLTFPAQMLSINFDENSRYLKKEFPKYINIEKALPVLSPTENNALFTVNTFPYFANDYYLNLLDYEFDKHSFIIGASGSGKSKFIELLVDRLSKTAYKNNYRVLVIDPHASLGDDMKSIEDSQIIDFSGDSAPELFGDSAKTDVSASTELTTTLMKSLLADQFNPKVERVLRFSLYILFTAQTMSLSTLKRFLTELELRNQIMHHVSGKVPPNIEQFFATDYNEIRTTHYTEAILPIISLVDEMQLQPGLVSENEVSLSRAIHNNFLTVFSLNKVSMGEKVVKTAAGILMQQIFLLAQARAFNEKIILIVDEVSVVQSPALASILAEARKYNLFVILTQQYFGQVEKSLKDAIYSNVYNYYIFRVSEEDAEGLIGNLNIDIPKEIIEEEHKKGISEETIKKQLMTELHPRECLVRVSANGQIIPVFKARTLDIGISHKDHSFKAEHLHEAKPVEVPKVDKFIEGKNNIVDNAPVFNLSSSELDSKIAPVNSSAESSDKEKTYTVSEDRPFNPESEESIFGNLEIDPIERRDAKERKSKKASKIASIIAKNEVSLVEASANPINQEVLKTSAEETFSSGFGSGNLASILASQSSSNETVNRR
ncbi:ATP-binding protein [Candidatus Saccharibacteria bacterium]|nr:ATP-binding protein [Candidatus Saccharibacteria bacterium]